MNLEILDLDDDSRLDLYQLIRDFPRVRAAAGSPSVRVDEVMRLLTSTKLGYKNPKWITAIEVTNTFMPSFWEKAGFSWFGGI
jgi:hypothetical protein